MPTREELEEEDRRVRQLRIAVGLALSVIGQTDMTLAQAQEMVAATDGILTDNGIRSQGTPDVMAIWNAKAAQ